METKNILVITHSNNDFDHFLPLLVEFKKDKTKHVTPLVFYEKNDLLKNRLHNYICKEHNIQLESFTGLFGLKPLSNFMIKLYTYCFANIKTVHYTGKTLNRIKDRLKNFFSSPHDSLVRILYFVSKKYIVLYSIFLIKHKHIDRYFSEKKFDLVIIDIRGEKLELLQLKSLQKFIKITKGEMKADDDIMFRFLAGARERNIPILAITHGPCYLIEEPMDLAGRLYKGLFRADYTIHCNLTGQKRDEGRLGLKKDFLYGDPRYDPYWIDYVESCASKLYKDIVKKPKDKKVVLYISSFLQRNTYYDSIDVSYYNEIHKDILSLVNYFPEIEVWMKYHPRRVYEIPMEKYIERDKQKYVKFFDNNFDTSVLMTMADIVVSPMSSTLTIPVLHKKPVVYYYRWKEKTGDVTVTTVFDELSFIIKAENHNELKKELENVLHGDGYKTADSDIALFYNKMFSVNSPYENMTKKCMKVINSILENKL